MALCPGGRPFTKPDGGVGITPKGRVCCAAGSEEATKRTGSWLRAGCGEGNHQGAPYRPAVIGEPRGELEIPGVNDLRPARRISFQTHYSLGLGLVSLFV